MSEQQEISVVGKRKTIHFITFLTADDRTLRRRVLDTPLATAVCAFILNCLIRRKSITESLLYFAGVFLLVCFIGLVTEIVKRRGLR